MAIKYKSKKTGEEDMLRYSFALRPYIAETHTFDIDISIHPPRVITPGYNLEEYPEALKLIQEKILDVDKHFTRSQGHNWGITVHFTKEDTDEKILETLVNLQDVLTDIGIMHSGMVVVIAGIPDITYGQNYLEHTTSVEDVNLLDIIQAVSLLEPTYVKAMADVPIVSNQKFDPTVSTDLRYLDKVTAMGIQRILSRDNTPAGVSKVLEGLLGDIKSRIEATKEVEETPKETEKTYNTKNSEEYSSFQNNWI